MLAGSVTRVRVLTRVAFGGTACWIRSLAFASVRSLSSVPAAVRASGTTPPYTVTETRLTNSVTRPIATVFSTTVLTARLSIGHLQVHVVNDQIARSVR